MSSDKSDVKLIQKNKMDRIIAQRANAEALSDAKVAAKAEGRAEGKVEGKAEGARQALLNSIHTVLSRKVTISRDALSIRFSQRSIAELESLLAVGGVG